MAERRPRTVRQASHVNAPASKRSPSRAEASGLRPWRKVVEISHPGPHGHVVLLGLRTFDSRELLRSIESGLPYRAFEHLVANTTIPSDAALVLVNIRRRTLTRRKREGRFHQDESDRLLRASRVFGRVLALFEGNRQAAKRWLSEPQRALGGEVPLMLARTELGALEVERLIGRLEHGVFT